MNYKIKKKLIHFYTTGNIAEDFVSSRRKKVTVMRRIIRGCFYLHCAAALLCIGLSILLGSGLEIVLITLFTVLAAWLALFAVGDAALMKLALIAADVLLAAAGYVTGALVEHKAVFFSCAAVMTIAALAAVGSYLTSLCRAYLEGFSPRLVRRDDYTLLHNFAPETDEIISLRVGDELPPLPPLTSEMRELANQLKEILCAVPEKEPDEELIEEITQSVLERENEQKITVKNSE
ncbi:MAG: hypothetical protein K2N38_10755 [Oscillospiraceae bacterium]|nr:hypothetical protein [Oscillospiraceae bacterium]